MGKKCSGCNLLPIVYIVGDWNVVDDVIFGYSDLVCGNLECRDSL